MELKFKTIIVKCQRCSTLNKTKMSNVFGMYKAFYCVKCGFKNVDPLVKAVLEEE